MHVAIYQAPEMEAYDVSNKVTTNQGSNPAGTILQKIERNLTELFLSHALDCCAHCFPIILSHIPSDQFFHMKTLSQAVCHSNAG